jgi:hypothetical protein
MRISRGLSLIALGAGGLVHLPSTPRDEKGDDRMPLPAELFRRALARSILTAPGERAARRDNEDPAAREGG